RRQRPAKLTDQVVEPLARMRYLDLHRGGARQENPLGQRRPRPQVHCQRHRQWKQQTIGKEELQTKVDRLLKGTRKAQSEATQRQKPDQASRGNEQLGDQQQQAERQKQERPGQSAHGSSTTTEEDQRLQAPRPRRNCSRSSVQFKPIPPLNANLLPAP